MIKYGRKTQHWLYWGLFSIFKLISLPDVPFCASTTSKDEMISEQSTEPAHSTLRSKTALQPVNQVDFLHENTYLVYSYRCTELKSRTLWLILQYKTQKTSCLFKEASICITWRFCYNSTSQKVFIVLSTSENAISWSLIVLSDRGRTSNSMRDQ